MSGDSTTRVLAPPIVLVVDSDLGFLVSLSYELHRRGIESLPASTTGEARSMLRQFRLACPDLVVINCAILGACTFARDMSRLRPDMPIIGIVSEGNDCKNCEDLLKAKFRDPEDKEPERIPYCTNVIEALVKEQRHTTTGRA